jgi:hypothetical protein
VMKSVLEHRDQVVARVVAWHNRHPLARRITPDQVHSVGVVSLPFAVRGAVAGAPEADTTPLPEAELLADPPLAAADPADPAEPAAAPAAEAAPADEAGIEAVVELDVDPAIESDSTVAAASESAVAAPVEAASVTPAADDAAAQAPPDATPPSILDRALDAGVPATDPGEAPEVPEAPATNKLSAPSTSPSSPSETDSVAASPAAQAGADTRRPAAFLPARLPRWHPLAWWAALRGRAPFQALFSEDFIAPLRPRRVARWVAAHGVAARPLAAHDPCRQIALDPGRRRAGDAATEVDLHVITAAIGVEDRRHRLLLSPDGRVLGRRQWDRGRMATTAGLGLATIFGLGLGLGLAPWLGIGGVHPHADPVEAAASAPSPVASGAAADDPAATAVAHAASGVSDAQAAAAVALAASAGETDADPQTTTAPAAPAASGVSGASLATAEGPHAAPKPHDAHAAASAAADAPAGSAPVATPTAAAVTAGPASVPTSVSPQPGRVVLPPLVPRLADAQREAARTASRSVRKEAPVEPGAAPDAKSWALVSRVMTNRRLSERAAAQLQAVALLQPVPMRAELLASDGGWRAVFWPFPSVQDAEKVRLALADKGLPLAVVEF